MGWRVRWRFKPFTDIVMMSHWKVGGKKEHSEWQVNWWDLQDSGSGPDVEARQGGMVCQLIRLCPPTSPQCRINSWRGPVQVPARVPVSQRITSFPLTQIAISMCSYVCRHEGMEDSLKHLGINSYCLKLHPTFYYSWFLCTRLVVSKCPDSKIYSINRLETDLSCLCCKLLNLFSD